MNNHQVIIPPATIGILGGGQLGRMLALSAREMGYGIVTLDPTPHSPCGQVADQQIVADFHDVAAARQLAKNSDVITFEFENIPAHIVKCLQESCFLPQGHALLRISQNRLREKQTIQQGSGLVAPYRQVSNGAELQQGVAEFGFPCILKTCEGGYDGKGQLVIDHAQALAKALVLVAEEKGEWILEQTIEFTKELSVIVARNPQGQTTTFPVVENVHRHNILQFSMAPARISQSTVERVKETALKLAQQLGLVGLLAIELFLQPDGTIIINEVAPRPHNSGHYTRQACLTSQFEQHIRAICGLPLAEPELLQPTVMVNILGEHLEPVRDKLASLPSDCKVHLYGKQVAKTGRKMGHLNVMATDVETALQQIARLNIWNMEGIM